jgi:hypothetical protein
MCGCSIFMASGVMLPPWMAVLSTCVCPPAMRCSSAAAAPPRAPDGQLEHVQANAGKRRQQRHAVVLACSRCSGSLSCEKRLSSAARLRPIQCTSTSNCFTCGSGYQAQSVHNQRCSLSAASQAGLPSERAAHLVVGPHDDAHAAAAVAQGQQRQLRRCQAAAHHHHVLTLQQRAVRQLALLKRLQEAEAGLR